MAAAGAPDQAIAEYEAALALEPGHLPAYLSLSQALLANGQPGEAEAVVRKALELYPGSVEAQAALAAVQSGTGQGSEAANTLLQAWTSNPRRPALGQTLIDLGDLEAAEQIVAP